MPELSLSLARLYALRHDVERSRQHAGQAATFFRARAEADRDNVAARLSWSQAEVLREDFPAALSILQEGLRRQPDPRYTDALAQAYVAFSDFKGAQPHDRDGRSSGSRQRGPPAERQVRARTPPAPRPDS